jgi:hypothetical protein
MIDEQTRRWAKFAGDSTTRALAMALDRLDDVALRALEQAAIADIGDKQLGAVEQRLRALRELAVPVPRVGGRLIAASVYFAARWTPEVVRCATEVVRETSEFLDSDPEDHTR